MRKTVKSADGTTSSLFLWGRLIYMAAAALIGFAAVWMKPVFSGKAKRRAAWMVYLLSPFVFLWALEYDNIVASRLPWQLFFGMGGGRHFVLAAGVVFVLLFLFSAITNRMRLAGMLLGILICVFGCTCYFVYALRGDPFLATDLATAGTAMDVAGGYTFRFNYQSVAMLMSVTVWLDIAGWIGEERIALRGSLRAAGIVFTAVIWAVFIVLFFRTDFLTENGVHLNTFNPAKSYRTGGAILTFCKSIRLMMVEKPEGYSTKAAQKIADQWTSDEQDDAKPNVIIVMDEAFSDLQSWMDFETTDEVTPFFRSLKENTIRGDFYVSSYGGKTANTEFEVLTGDSMGFLPMSSTPYQLFIKNDMTNLNTDLKSEGYENTVAMHPFHASGYNRDKVYQYFGFDKRIFMDQFQNPKLVKGLISDDSDVDRLIQEYEEAKKKSDQPFFIHNVTMQNHSPFDTVSADELGDAIHLKDNDVYPDVDTYLTLAHKSDQALEKLINYFKGVKEPTVILFFGDHQPKLDSAFIKSVLGTSMDELKDPEKLMEFYHTEYVMWANFDIPERENVDLSSNYLISMMKQVTGMKLTGYNRFLLSLQKKIPILTLHGYFGDNGKFYKISDKTSPYYDLIRQYHMLVYNHIFDKTKVTWK